MIALLASFTFTYTNHGDAIKGSNKLVTEVRSVKDFHGIRLDHAVKVRLSKGPYKVQVRVDDNLQSIIKTEVHAGILRVSSRKGYQSEKPAELLVQAPSIDKITLSGASELIGTDFNPGQLVLEIDGGSSLDLSKLNVKNLDLDASGASRVVFHQITSSTVKVDASGGSETTFDGLTTDRLDLETSGAAEIQLSGSSGHSSIDSSGGSEIKAAQLKTPFVKLEADGASRAWLTKASVIKGEIDGGATVHVAKTAKVDLERSVASTVILE